MYLTSFLGSVKRLMSPMKAPRAKATISRTPHRRTMDSKLRIGQHFLGDQAAPVLALFFGMAQLHEQAFDDLPLARGPIACLADLLFGLAWLGSDACLFEPHAVVAQIGAQPGAHLGGALGRFAMGMEPVAPLLGLEIGHPDVLAVPAR